MNEHNHIYIPVKVAENWGKRNEKLSEEMRCYFCGERKARGGKHE